MTREQELKNRELVAEKRIGYGVLESLDTQGGEIVVSEHEGDLSSRQQEHGVKSRDFVSVVGKQAKAELLDSTKQPVGDELSALIRDVDSGARTREFALGKLVNGVDANGNTVDMTKPGVPKRVVEVVNELSTKKAKSMAAKYN